MDPQINTQVNTQARLTLISGAARSGKTALAVRWASSFPHPRVYIATAQSLDEEMAERIRRHQEERGAAFQTIEEPLALDLLLEKIRGTCSIAVVDCLTMWLSNLLGDLGEDLFRIQQSMNDLLSALQGTDVPLILIGNEVGWGIVPDNRLARTFRDLNGSLNQEIARIADQVILMAAGIPLVIKR